MRVVCVLSHLECVCEVVDEAVVDDATLAFGSDDALLTGSFLLLIVSAAVRIRLSEPGVLDNVVRYAADVS